MKLSLSLFAIGLGLMTSPAWSVTDATTPTPATPTQLVQNLTSTQGITLLADNTGKTLYVFDLDEGKATPACNADCAEVWPPYLITAEEAATLAAPLGQIARKNGKLQLTYNGSPVYTYIFDRLQADDKGDGLGGVWHIIETSTGPRP